MMIRLLLLVTLLIPQQAFAFFGSPKAKKGDVVRVEYTGKLKDGSVFDTNVGKQPLQFQIGAGMMLPKFEQAFLGMKTKQAKTIKIAAKEAYGEYDKNKIVPIPKDKLPKGAKVGDKLTFRSAQGNFPVVVSEIMDKEAKIDTNHFLAGKDLNFEVKLLEIVKK